MTDPIMAVLKDRKLVDDHNLILNRHNADNHLRKLLRADAGNYTNAPAFVERNKYFFTAPDGPQLSSSRPSFHLHGVPASIPHPSPRDLSGALSFLEHISPEDWTINTIRTCVNSIINIKVEESLNHIEDDGAREMDETRKALNRAWSRRIHSYIRWAIAAGVPGPDGAEFMEILGREETLARLDNAAPIALETPIEASLEEHSCLAS